MNSGAPTGMVPLNHVDHYVAEQTVATTGALAAVTNMDPLVTTSTQPKVVPPSLFLDSGDEDDDDSYNQNEMAHVLSEGTKTPSPLPVPTMDPSSDDNISDSADAAGADVHNNNDDALPEDTDVPQDPNVPLNISLGPAEAMASNGLSGHLSPSLEVCFNVQVGALATYLPPGLIVDGTREGPYITGDMHSIISANDYKAQADTYGVLQVHADDAQILTDQESDDLHFFNTRSILIFQAWDTFHACASIANDPCANLHW